MTSGTSCDGPGGPSRVFDRRLSIAETAGILGVGSTTVRRLVAAGLIAHERVSKRRIVIRESSLHAYLKSVRQGDAHHG